jgi:hypothetical protein
MAAADPVTITFPLLANTSERVTADVVSLRPARPDGSGDTAVLRLRTAPPAGAGPVRMLAADPPWGHAVQLFGFPTGLTDGGWLGAEVRSRQATGWLQIESVPGGHRVTPGFSGSPAWSPANGAVVGIVVAANRSATSTTSYLLPAATLLAAHPELAAPDPTAICPYRGLDPFLAEHADYFRGREWLTDQLAAKTEPVVVVVGPSGSGKSSLVHAGLVPRLRERGTLVAEFRPITGTAPATLLAEAVLPVLEPELTELDRHDEAVKLAERLSRADTLPWLANRLANQGDLVLIADQVEELADEDARALYRLLRDLVNAGPRRRDSSCALRVVLTARSTTLDALAVEDTDNSLTRGLLLMRPMSRADLRAVVTVADVTFEPGLIDRILDDAEHEPSQLPPLQFALAQLWNPDTLTHDAYQQLGGVSGALARYAQQVYDTLPAPDRDTARRLLVQLAQPDTEGGFTRRPARLAGLDDAARAVLARLTASRLVVVDRTVDGHEIADLAHQALLRQWPALGTWLADDREFRAWQEQLRVDLAQWQPTRDRDGLLRGTALATAEDWLAQRGADLPPAEHVYITASRANRRRRRLVLRGVVAVIAVLAVVAATLATVAIGQTRVAQSRLRTAASRALADDANRFRTIDPAMSLQLAQAAWHEDHTAEAYGALLAQYATVQPVNRVFQNLWQGDFGGIQTSTDGSVAVITANGVPFVWTGLTGDHPTHWRLPTNGRSYSGGKFALSPDGHHLAYANDQDAVLLWDTRTTAAPVVLAEDIGGANPEPLVVHQITFSADGNRLLIWRASYGGTDPTTDLWDIAHRRRLPVANLIAPIDDANTVMFGPSDQSATFTDLAESDVVDLATGQTVRHVPRPEPLTAVVAGLSGSVAAECVDVPGVGDALDTGLVRVVDLATGAVRRSVAVPECTVDFMVDSTTNYAVVPPLGAHDTDTNATMSAVDLHSGRVYSFTLPPVDITDALQRADRLAIVPGPGGTPVALLAHQDLLYRVTATGTVKPPVADRFSSTATSYDNRYRVSIADSGRSAPASRMRWRT